MHSTTAFIRGKEVALTEPKGGDLLITRELGKNNFYADSAKGSEKWIMIWIHIALALIFLAGGVLLILGGFSLFPERQSGWGVGAGGACLLLLAVWFGRDAFYASFEHRELIIKGKQIILRHSFRGREKEVFTGSLQPEDYLICHLREDAEQDMFSISGELKLSALPYEITLFITSVEIVRKSAEESFDTIFQRGLDEAADRAFDWAEEIGDLLEIKVVY